MSRHFAGYSSVALETIWLHEPRDLIFLGPLMTLLCLSRYSNNNDRIATQRSLTPEIPIGSPVISRTTSEPSDGRSRKMVANVAGCRSFCTFQFNSIQFSLFPAHINISYSNNNVYILCRKRGGQKTMLMDVRPLTITSKLRVGI